jgi:uncharacterized protein
MTTVAHALSAQHLAEEFSRTILTRDWPALAQIVTPDVTWTFPGNNALSGTVTGPAQIAAKAELILSYDVQIGVEYVMFGVTSFIIKLHNTGRRGDLMLDEHVGTVCTVRDGRIASAETHLSDITATDAFFVPLAD